MTNKNIRKAVNASSRPRAEPDKAKKAEAKAIETAMETGKERRIRKKEQAERVEHGADIPGGSESSFEFDTRDRSTRTQSVREGRVDTESVKDARTHSKSQRRMRMEQQEAEDSIRDGVFGESGTSDEGASKHKASSKLRDGEGSRMASKLRYVEEDGVTSGTGMARSRRRRYASAAVNEGIHRKIRDQEDENAGVEAAHRAEMLGEDAARRVSFRTSQKLRERSAAEIVEREKKRAGETLREGAKKRAASGAKQEAEHKRRLRKRYQKQRYKRQYAAAKYAEQKGKRIVFENARMTTKAAAVMQEAFARKGKLLIILGILSLIFFLTMTAITSCTASIHGMTTSIMATTYPSTDDDIYKTEEAYADMEAKLNAQINRMENAHSNYDDYIYQVDEISHNPYHLISYFTTKYGQFTYRQIKNELAEIFQEQYTLTTKEETGTITEKKKVKVGESLGKVVTSGYCNCVLCCGPWAGGATASGKMPKANHTIAVDAYHPKVPMGTHVIMNGTEYVVEDTGAFYQYGVDFDVYYNKHSTATAHGHKTWEAYLADSNGKKEITVTTTHTVNRFYVKMTNHDLDEVLRARMSKDEIAQYEVLNASYGNRDYLFDLDSLTTYSPKGGGQNYQVPPEALSDKKFARMLKEAKKYLGYPYVWGGASPSTSFDCSGFVCWVINHCGNGWNVGRRTAEELRTKCCVKVSPKNAKPGDLIFFEKTYNTSGASHVGIYVGNGMMIHCGDPIQFTSIKTSYWKSHFLAYGRIKD